MNNEIYALIAIGVVVLAVVLWKTVGEKYYGKGKGATYSITR